MNTEQTDPQLNDAILNKALGNATGDHHESLTALLMNAMVELKVPVSDRLTLRNELIGPLKHRLKAKN